MMPGEPSTPEFVPLSATFDRPLPSDHQSLDREKQSTGAFRCYVHNQTRIRRSLVVLGMLVWVAVCADILAPYDSLEPTGSSPLDSPSGQHLLGTDQQGRDVLSLVIVGSRMSLLVGVVSVLVAVSIGGLLAGTARFFGDVIERPVRLIVDGLGGIPAACWALFILVVFGPGFGPMVLAVSLGSVGAFAHVLCLQGVPTSRLLPLHCWSPDRHDRCGCLMDGYSPRWLVLLTLLKLGVLHLAMAIGLAAALGFIGLGMNAPTPSWGEMMGAGWQTLTHAPWILVVPAVALATTLATLTRLYQDLRNALNFLLHE